MLSRSRLRAVAFLGTVAILAAAPLAAGCGPDGADPGTGAGAVTGDDGATLTISVAALLGDDAPAGVGSLRVALFAGPVEDPAATPVFDTGCIAFQGDTLRLFNQPPGEGYGLLVDLYGDDACETFAHRGVRGGITIEKGGNDQTPYVVPVASVGAFRRLPGDAGTPPDGHFPLGPWRPRAFHTATAVGDGRVVIAGGAESVSGDQVIGGDGWPVVLDTRTMLFTRVPGGPLAGQRIMAHGGAALPDGRLVVAGGIEALRLGLTVTDTGRALTFDVPPTICYTDACDTPNFVQEVTLVNPVSGTAQPPVPLTTARAFPTLDLVERPAGLTLVLAGGVPGNDRYDDFEGFGCVYASDGSIECESAELVATRAGQASACFRTDGEGVCTGLAYVGGVRPNQPFVEYVGGDDDEFVAANTGGAPTDERLSLVRAGGAEGVVFVAGGVRGDRIGDARFSGGASVTITASGAGDYVPFEGDGDLPAAAARLLFHTVTELGEGRVLVAGGLDEDLQPTARAFVLRADGAEFVVEQVLSLAEARFGHAATRIEGGPFDGAVLVTGGLATGTVDENDRVPLTFLQTAEILIPAHTAD